MLPIREAAVAILKVTCPGCATTLKSPNPDGFPAGKAVKCPKCQQSFPVTEPPPASAAPAPVKVKAKAARAVEDDDEPDEDDDRPKKKKKKGKKLAEANPTVYWAVRGVVLVVLLGVLFVAWGEYQKKQKRNQEIEQQNAATEKRNKELEERDKRISQPITPADLKK